MNKLIITLAAALVLVLVAFNLRTDDSKSGEPWTEEQLMAPSDLSQMITDKKKVLIYSIGPAGLIKNAVNIGEAKDKANLQKFRQEISELPRNADIVIYCGCCPFGDCPNIRPSFKLLNDMKFTNHKLLNLPKNLKVDWIDKGYPMHND
jgi:hypothetical protein